MRNAPLYQVCTVIYDSGSTIDGESDQVVGQLGMWGMIINGIQVGRRSCPPSVSDSVAGSRIGARGNADCNMGWPRHRLSLRLHVLDVCLIQYVLCGNAIATIDIPSSGRAYLVSTRILDLLQS